MEQIEIREKRERIEKRQKRLLKTLIRSAENLRNLEESCKHPSYKKGKKECPDCGKIFKRKRGGGREKDKERNQRKET